MPRTTRKTTAKRDSAPSAAAANKTSINKKRKLKADHPLKERPIPIEVLSVILSFLDSTADRKTLVSLTTVSRAFFDVVVPVLYEHISVTETQLVRLVVNGQAKKHQKQAFRTLQKLRSQGVSRLSWSSQHALRHITRLSLLSRPLNSTIEALWAATIPNIPLFPNVRYLQIAHSIRPGDDRHGPPSYPTYPLDEDVLLFDTPHVCCRGDEHLLDYLPTKEAQSLTAHTPELRYSVSGNPHSPVNARPCRVFLCPAKGEGYDNPAFWADARWIHEQPKPTPTLYINMPSATYYAEALAKFNWRPNDKTHNLAFIEGIEPCVVCGRTWDDEIGSGRLEGQ